MSIGIQRLLETQSVSVDYSGKGLSPEYMVVLNHMWNGRFDVAAEHASMFLAEDDEHPATLRLYRAWIESLAELGDQDSLVMLLDHLLVLGRVEPELHQSFMALRGVIHLHLDQAPAARLVLRAIQGRDNNPYCLEFEQMCARRGFELANQFALVNSNVEVVDWLHWNTLIADFATDQTSNEWQELLHHVNRAFPGSPTFDLLNMHRAIDSGHWPSALASSTRLHANFPEHLDYGFIKSFCEFQSGDRVAALASLNSLGKELNESDADVLHLAGEILAGNAIATDNDAIANLAIQKLEASCEKYRRNGKPTDNAVCLIHSLKRHFVGSVESDGTYEANRVPRSWMVMLSPVQTANMLSSGDQDVGLLHRPMGKDAMPGDIVLYMSKAAHIAKKTDKVSNEWLILAVYRVITAPYRHPTSRWHNSLELVDRLDSPIPIDANDVSSDRNVRGKSYSLPRGHHARFGVYELDGSAMDIVVAAVKRRTDGVQHETNRRSFSDIKKDSV